MLRSKVKGQIRSNVVKNVILLPTLAKRITKQVKDDDDLYEGQRSTEVISGQGTCHRDDTVMSSSFFCLSTCQYLRDPMSDYAHTWSQ